MVDLPKPRLRGVLHQVAFFAFLPPLVWLLVARPEGPGERTAVVVYALGILAMLGASALYHRGRWTPAVRKRMRRLDHSMILLAIAGTYTPVVGIGLRSSATRTLVLTVVWAGALVGIAIRMLWMESPRGLSSSVYIIVGWVAVLALPTLARSIGATAFGLVLGGGILYTVGALAFAMKRWNFSPVWFGYHEVFHVFVVVAAVVHYVAVLVILDRT